MPKAHTHQAFVRFTRALTSPRALSPTQAKFEAAAAALAADEVEAIAHLEAVNQLGVLWANRGEYEKAFGYLDKARDIHTRLSGLVAAAAPAAAPTVAPAAAKDGARDGAADGASVVVPREISRLEDQYTLTCFYLAQVRVM